MRGVIDTADYLIAGPTLEPIDLEEVKKQRRFSATSLDTLFDMWMSASRQDFETMTGLALLTQTREFALDAFPCQDLPDQDQIELPSPPVQAIVSLVYDAGGEEQTLDAASYRLTPAVSDPPLFKTYPNRAKVALVAGASWPVAAIQRKAVRIRYTCGFGDAPGAVPEIIVYALNLFVGHAHKFSEEVQEGKVLQRLPYGAAQILFNAKWHAAQTLIPRSTWAD